MGKLDELCWLDATAQAELIRKREVTSLELVDNAIKRIEELNPKLNAVITPIFDQARKTASGAIPKGPFSGVPFLLKDIGASLAGVPMAMGTALLKGYVPDQDSELTIRYKKAGLIILGKTNTPEFGLIPTTEPRLFGPTRNPWNTERTTGGSSGGSAAAVASGMVSLAHGNDGGGSIRIPSSCCGLFGLKPTRARNSLGPAFGDLLSGLVCEHVLTRSVRDSAAILDLTAGPVDGDPYWAPPQKKPFLQEVGADPGRLRIALAPDSAIGELIHPDCKQAVAETARLLESLGHIVEEATPTVSTETEKLTPAFSAVWYSGCASTIDMIMQAVGMPAQPDFFEPLTWYQYELGRKYTASEYLRAIIQIQRLAREIAVFHQKYDVMLTPVLAQPPVPIGTFDVREGEDPAAAWSRIAAFAPITPLQNLTGQPAMSVPLFWNQEGLPIGSHFVGRFGDEATLFRLAAQLEQARPWTSKRPLIP
jgi:amidase